MLRCDGIYRLHRNFIVLDGYPDDRIATFATLVSALNAAKRPSLFRSIGAMASTAAVLMLAACAGSLSETAELSTGTVASSRYVLTEAEKSWNCATLEVALKAQAPRLVALESKVKAEREAAAPTVVRTFSRMFGPPGSDSQSLDDLKRERAIFDAYNEALRGKGCTPVSLDGVKLPPPAPVVANGHSAPGPATVGATTDLGELQKLVLPRGY